MVRYTRFPTAMAIVAMASFMLWPASGLTQIKAGDMVSFEYTLTDDKGKKLDSNRGKEPLIYQHGKGNIIPGLEKQIAGMKLGEEKVIRVTPDQAYGPLNPQAVREVPKESLPKQDPNVGDMFVFQDPQGGRIPVTVKQIKDKTVIVDFNNPFAGKTLIFDIKIVDVTPGK